MNDFDYDVSQKKKLARNAKYRKSTKGRKGCTLPHELLTKKERDKLNGEIYSVNLNAPISWDDFKALTPTLQEEYLQHLMNCFGIGLNPIGEDMFGLSQNVLNNWVRRHGIKLNLRTGGRTSKAAFDSWHRWLDNKTAPVTDTAPEPEALPEPTPEPEEDVKPFRAHDHELPRFTVDKVQPNPITGNKEETANLYPTTDMNLTMKGTPVDILTALRMSFPTLLDAGREYRVTISINRTNRCSEDWRPDHL